MSRKMLFVLICTLVALSQGVVSENGTEAHSHRDNVTEVVVCENDTETYSQHDDVTGTLSEDVDLGAFCAFGWTHYNSRCFVYISYTMTWPEAQRHCQLMNANLASVHGDDEYEALRKVIRAAAKENQKAWIGGSDVRKEGKWEWTDGSRFSYQFWCPKEPNDRRNEDCLLVNWKGTGCWNDSKCGSKRPFVCVK